MHLSNSYYGHKLVFARYCGVRPRKTIFGVIQHGVDDGTAFPSQSFYRRLPFFVWNPMMAKFYSDRGWNRVVTIGSPILYVDFDELPRKTLIKNESQQRWVAFAPHHILPGAGRDLLREFLSELMKVDFPAGMKIYLHKNEFDDEECLHIVEEFGYVASTVWTGENAFWDENFIKKMILELQNFDVGIFSQAGTAFWYAVYAGLDARVLNMREGQEIETRQVAIHGTEYRNHLFWPSNEFDLMKIRDSAGLELGVANKASPKLLADILGFTSLIKQIIGHALDLAGKVKRLIRNVSARK